MRTLYQVSTKSEGLHIKLERFPIIQLVIVSVNNIAECRTDVAAPALLLSLTRITALHWIQSTVHQNHLTSRKSQCPKLVLPHFCTFIAYSSQNTSPG